MTRELLHQLLDRIPDADLPAAQQLLENLANNPAYKTALAAAPDDEPVTTGDAAAIARAQDDLRTGRTVSHDEVLREFGLR
ncbi:MAG: hypothetical protein JJE04_24410 [Acidobacteriia bacterium]|nr:hypothetical protein [Terriglobia bacterium]